MVTEDHPAWRENDDWYEAWTETLAYDDSRGGYDLLSVFRPARITEDHPAWREERDGRGES